MAGHLSKSTGRLFRVLAVLLGIIAGLALAEGGASVVLHYLKDRPRAASWTHPFEPIPVQPHPYLQYRIRPNVSGAVITTNSLGLRNREVLIKPQENVFRILLLGGSVAWGNSAGNNDETIAALLETRLNQHYRNDALRFEVLNGAVPGYVSWQVALSYALQHRRLKPDLVISIDGVNDVYSGILNRRPGLPVDYQRTPPKESLRPSLLQWLQYRAERSKISRLGRRLLEGRLLGTLVVKVSGGLHSGLGASPFAVGTSYRKAMEYLSQLVSRDGAHLQIVLQPMSIFPEAKALTPAEREGASRYLAQMPGAESYFRASFSEIKNQMLELQNSYPESTAGFDASSLFSGVSEQVFLDHCHLTLLGRTVFASELAKRIVHDLDKETRP